LVACGSGSDQGTGQLKVSLTDGPVEMAEAVVIHFTGVSVHGGNGEDKTIAVYDPVTGDPGRSINLLDYAGDKSVVLFDDELAAGNYSWMRLEMDFDPTKSYIQISGNQYALECTSCENNGLKLNRSFKVDTDAVLAFTLDFDLRSSITDPQSGEIYKLRPTIRVVDSEAAGSISGTVSETLLSSIGGQPGCAVYVYEGNDATPNDIYLPANGNAPDNYNNPITTATVKLNQSTYEYTAGFLPAGGYTVALTCDAELDDASAMNSDTVTFTGNANVAVTAGQSATYDF
jgi:hypothetical protein